MVDLIGGENHKLSHEEVDELFVRWREHGDTEARDMIACSFFGFIVSRVNRLRIPNETGRFDVIESMLDDLYDTMICYKHTSKYSFMQYLSWRIFDAHKTTMAAFKFPWSVPLRHHKDIEKINDAMNINGHINLDDVAEMHGMGVELIARRIDTNREVITVETAENNCDGHSNVYRETMESPEELLIKEEDREGLISACKTWMGVLTDDERNVICMLYGIDSREPASITKTHFRLHMPRHKVQKLRDSALEKLSKLAYELPEVFHVHLEE